MEISLKNIIPPASCKNIEDVRVQIDNIDKVILKALGYRFQFVKEIVKFKSKDYESIKAQDRYDAVLKQRRNWAEENGINPDVIEKIYKELIHHFIDEEMKIINNENL